MSEQTEIPVEQEIDAEVKEAQSLALRENSLILSITSGQDATDLIQKRMKNLVQLRRAAFFLSSPSDWVLFRDLDGNEFAMLAGDSRERICDMLGISTSLARPVDDLGNFAPMAVESPDGQKGIRAWCDARCALMVRELLNIEATIWEDEDFTGRKGGRDHRPSLMTRLRAKAVRIFAGASRVPASELTDIFGGEEWKSKARKGHGYGSSADRQAEGVSETGLETAKQELREEILRFAAGDQNTAKAILKRITSYPAYTSKKTGKDVKAFAGMESVERFTKKWQIENAWDKLRNDTEYQAWNEGGGESKE